MKNGAYKWCGIEPVFDAAKGFTLKATKRLYSGLLVPYGGICIPHARAKNLCSNSARVNKSTGKRNTLGDYLAVVDHDLEGNPTLVMDAHPRHYPPNTPKYAWIGSFVCEPSQGERANADLVLMQKFDPKLPGYPLIDKEYIVCVEVKEDVRKGEEITAVYSLSKRCYRTRGYVRGLAWNETAPASKRMPLKIGPGNRSESQVKHSLKNLQNLNAIETSI